MGFTVYPLGQSVFKLEVATPVGSYEASDGKSTRLWFTFGASF